MGIIAEVHVTHEDLLLAPTIAHHPEVTIRYEHAVGGDATPLCFVSIFGDEDAALEEAMAVDHTVSEPARVASFESRTIYRLHVETDLEIVPDRCAERGLFAFAITSAERGWIVRFHLSDRSVLGAYREYCRDREVSFRVNQLCESTGDDGTYFLTEQQQEILSMAYYTGYYGIPRSVSQDYLAERLGISNSAVSQRLRRAVAELIAATIEDDRAPDTFE